MMLINDIENFVKDFNESIEVIYTKRKEVDYKYPFSISNKMMEMNKNDDSVWGGLKNVSYYCMNIVRDLGYQGLKLVYDGYYSNECPEENGTHKFHLECCDRRKE